jgi:serine phosphatase RsbU (regulator of sigma subunit)
MQTLSEIHTQPAAKSAQLYKRHNRYQQGMAQDDDITLVVMKRN